MIDSKRTETFDARMIERLENEIGGGGGAVEEEAPVEGLPPESMESEAVDMADSQPELEAEDTEDGIPEDENEEHLTEWEKRYRDAQSELTKYQQTKEQDAREHAEAMEEVIRARYTLEDTLKNQQQQGEYLVQMATANADQYRNINWSQVPPDQLPVLQQQAQQAFLQEQQFKNTLAQRQSEAQAAREEALRREALIARQRLVRTIPDFDSAYPQMAKYAAERGLSPSKFGEITDPALMEMIHDSMRMRKAPVEVEKKTKAKLPKSRLSPDRARGTDGKFKKAERDFREAKDSRSRADAWQRKAELRLSKEGR